jgi:hypothetical protein
VYTHLHPPPPPTSPPAILASDAEPIFPGLSADDILTIYFTRPTNRPDVSTQGKLLTLLAFSPALATTYRASWQSGGDDGDRNASERLVITLSGAVLTDIAASLLPNVRVSVLPGGGLQDAGLCSPAAAMANLDVGGTWGDASQPQLLADDPVLALDYGTQSGLGPGDALALRFNQPVAQVPVGTKEELDALLLFEPVTWASDYIGTWLDYMTLLVGITSVDPRESSAPTFHAAVAVRTMRVTVLSTGNLTSFDGTSEASNASSVVTSGSWGDPVCDAALHVYSHTALVVSFVPSPVASYTPDSYSVQVLSSDGAEPLLVRSMVVLAAGSNGSVELPAASSPPSSLRFVVSGLTSGVSYLARVAPMVPSLPTSLHNVLPRLVPLAYVDVGHRDGGSHSPGCPCVTLASGAMDDSCSAGQGNVTAIAPQPPVIGGFKLHHPVSTNPDSDVHMSLVPLPLCSPAIVPPFPCHFVEVCSPVIGAPCSPCHGPGPGPVYGSV